MARYHIETYGCTANRGESREIERALRDGGHRPADGPDEADVAILNTCTVVETTEDRMLRRAADLDDRTPGDLVVTGCMALAQGEAFASADVDATVLHWDDVPAHVRNGECPTPTADVEPVVDGVVGILPIARGCTSDCSYCITKHATGEIDSPPVEDNVAKARALVHAGARELRITGQDTGVYGWDDGERKLPELLDRICTEIDVDGDSHGNGTGNGNGDGNGTGTGNGDGNDGVDFRVRVGMANPKGVHGIREELARVFARHDELYDFLHVPVQSGSDAVLGDMRRQHQVSEFREVVATFDEYLGDWTLATDVIVGFPTETDRDLAQTDRLLREVRPEKINVTRFSKRPGTDAAAMKGLGGQTKKDRSKAISALKKEIMGEAYADMVGDVRSVLLVEDGTDESLVGYDRAYRQVAVPRAEPAGLSVGDVVDVEVTGHNTVYALGEPVSPRPEA